MATLVPWREQVATGALDRITGRPDTVCHALFRDRSRARGPAPLLPGAPRAPATAATAGSADSRTGGAGPASTTNPVRGASSPEDSTVKTAGEEPGGTRQAELPGDDGTTDQDAGKELPVEFPAGARRGSRRCGPGAVSTEQP